MSLITRCPACGTMFKVVPDQLRISEGWVRCGHCAEVFDASAHLQEAAGTASLPPREVADASLPAQAVQQAEAHADVEVNTRRPDSVPHESPPEPVLPAPRHGPESSSPAVANVAALLSKPTVEDHVDDAGAAYPPFEFVRADLSAQQALGPNQVQRADEALTDDDVEDADLSGVSFVRQARRDAFWRKTGVRVVLALLALGLGGALAVQFAVQERDRLAARQPELRPLLANLCQSLGCTIAAPRQIEAIVIDSSSFNRLRGDAYRLSLTLKNQAGNAVAMPAVELTLTDTQDQPVVRRVLTAAELGADSTAIAAASEWSGNLALSVAANGSTPRIAGYRLLAFYP